MSNRSTNEKQRSESIAIEGGSPPRRLHGVPWVLAAVVVAAVIAFWVYEPAPTPLEVLRSNPAGDPLPDRTADLTVENGEPVLVSTELGEMAWQRLVGADFAAVRASAQDGWQMVTHPEVDPAAVAWPGAMRSWGGQTEPDPRTVTTSPAGETELMTFNVPGVDGPLRVEPPEMPVRVYSLVPGRSGSLLLGEPWGTGAPLAWIEAENGSFVEVGTLPFWVDYVGVGNRERPLVLPVEGGFAALGHGDGSTHEVSTPRAGQELWWSSDGRFWELVDADPFGEDQGYILVLSGFGGRWVGIQPPGAAEPGWVWTSDNGMKWERASESPLAFGWCSLRVTGGEMGWVARDCGNRPLWLSRDGVAWQSLPGQEALFEGFDYVQGEVWVERDRIVVDSGSYRGSVGWVGELVFGEPDEIH